MCVPSQLTEHVSRRGCFCYIATQYQQRPVMTMSRNLFLLYLTFLTALPVSLAAAPVTGLEINKPRTLSLIYTVEPKEIDQTALQSLIDEVLAETPIQLASRDDAQLYLRVEKHAGRYLLYLDFSRLVSYCANGQRYSKDGFVWGRYAKDISDIDQLHEDVAYLFEEFIKQYQQANQLTDL